VVQHPANTTCISSNQKHARAPASVPTCIQQPQQREHNISAKGKKYAFLDSPRQHSTTVPTLRRKPRNRNASVSTSIFQHRMPLFEVPLEPSCAPSSSMMLKQILEVGTRRASTGYGSPAWNVQRQCTRVALLMAVYASRRTKRSDAVAIVHG
jgi:hypothetical protein